MEKINELENLTGSERVTRLFVAIGVIVAIMESSLVGSTLFAVINLLAIAFATIAIVGWDPVRAISLRSKLVREKYRVQHSRRHV